MSIYLTIISGVSVFIFGQFVLKLVIDPAQKLKETIGEVAFSLWNEHAIIHNADSVDRDEANETYLRLRNLGARLASGYQVIPFYSGLRLLFGLPDSENISLAGEKLFEMSNNMWGKHNDKYYLLDLCRIEVCEALKIGNPIKNGLTKDQIMNSIKK